MRRTLRSALAALSVLVLSPAAFAKDEASADFPAQVRGYLTEQASKHTADGFRQDTSIPDFVRAIRLEGGVIWQAPLRRGATYRVLAVCDNDCSDVDMEVFDAQGGFVGRDVATSDNPYVEFAPSADGPAYVRIWLAACESEPCYVGARVYRK